MIRKDLAKLCLFFFLFQSAYSQTPKLVLDWLNHSTGGTYNEEVRALASDRNGNIYSVGNFWNTVDFDPGPGVASLTSGGNRDIFITKNSRDGSLVWVKQITSSAMIDCHDIIADTNGGLYITGQFAGVTDFDPSSAQQLITANSTNYFVEKLDTNGNFLWVNQGDGLSIGFSNYLTIGGDLITVGRYGPSMNVSSNSGSPTTLVGNDLDAFVEKRDLNGNLDWIYGFGGQDLVTVYDVQTDVFGHIYIAGTFDGTADFDPSSGSNLVTSNGGLDGFVLKLDSQGGFVSVFTFGGPEKDRAMAMTTDEYGNIYLSGEFTHTIDDDPSIGQTTLTSDSSALFGMVMSDAFVSKISPQGNLIWVKQLHGQRQDVPQDLTYNGYGQLYTVGLAYSDHFHVGSDAVVNVPNTNYKPHGYVVGLDTSGTYLDLFIVPWVDAVAVNQFQEVFISGHYSQSYFASTLTGASVNLTYSGGADYYLIKTNTCYNHYLTVDTTVCSPITLPSGQYVGGSGVYPWVYNNQYGCDSVVNYQVNMQYFYDSITINGGILSVPMDTFNYPTYQWMDCNTGQIVASGSNIFLAPSAGSYALIQSTNFCSDTTVCVAATSVDDLFPVQEIDIYPNPTSGEIRITNLIGRANIEIYSSEGRLVKTFTEFDLTNSLNVSDLKLGMFVMRIQSDRINAIQKFVKQ